LKEKYKWRECDLKPCSSFFCTFVELSKHLEEVVTVREIYRYLWLMGKYEQWKGRAPNAKMEGEVLGLLSNPTDMQRALLDVLTSGEYGDRFSEAH
jgi:hypothetical protein